MALHVRGVVLPDGEMRDLWLVGDQVRSYAGTGPLITDDAPRPEYFLLRGLNAIAGG